MSVVFGIPIANLAAIMIGEAVSAAIVIIVIILVASARIPPMAVVVFAISVITIPMIVVSLPGQGNAYGTRQSRSHS